MHITISILLGVVSFALFTTATTTPSHPSIFITDSTSVNGIVYLDASIAGAYAGVVVQLWPLRYLYGQVLPLPKRCVYGADDNVPAQQVVVHPGSGSGSVDMRDDDARGGVLAAPYTFDNIAFGNYTIVAYAFTNLSNPSLNFSHTQPMGWIKSDPCLGGWGAICTAVVVIAPPPSHAHAHAQYSPPPPPKTFDIVLTYSLAPEETSYKNSSVKIMDGLTVVQLRGSAEERGDAHGRMLARQVLDFFEFFLLEDRVTSPILYEQHVRPGLQSPVFNVSTHPGLLAEARALASGVCATIKCTTSLGRDLDEWDIVAINAYGVWPAAVQDESHLPSWVHSKVTGSLARGRACSQFILWGDATADGSTVHGRNMDGEIDVRKLTVSDFILFAVDPSESGYARYVSAMWPGFIGTYSGMNEHGWVMMDNAGCAGPRPFGTSNPIDTGIIRDFLLIASPSLPVATATAADIQHAIETGHRSSGGGVLVVGDILVTSRPYHNQPQGSGCMYEGDNRGGLVRLPHNPLVLPSGPRIGATNHFYSYNTEPWVYPTGYNPGATDQSPTPRGNGICNGRPSDFSTVWRFQAGCAYFESLGRSQVKVGATHMQQALASMAEAETEHSIIMLPNTMQLLVAVARLDAPMWDAPYQNWHRYDFDALFE